MTDSNWQPRYMFLRVAVSLPIQILRWLLSSLWGIFFTSAAFYLFVKNAGLIDPFSFQELALWFDSLSEASQGSLGASLLTVLGFLIAFQLSHRNILREKAIIKELQAADALRDHYGQFQELAADLDVYAHLIVTADKEVSDDPSCASFWADHLLSSAAENYEKRQELVRLLISGTMLGAKWSIVTARKFGLPRAVARMSDIASELVPHAYFVPPPDAASTNVIPPERIVRGWFKAEKAQEYSSAFKDVIIRLIWPNSVVSSSLHRSILPDQLGSWLNVIYDALRSIWSGLMNNFARWRSSTKSK